MTISFANDEFDYIPKLLRTEFTGNFGALGIKAGRFGYSAPLNFIAEGLFDGIQFTHSSPAGRFSLGAWYTGFLYKDDANIGMTEEDRSLNNVNLDFENFFETYFAPRRLFASIDWEHPSVADILRLRFSISGQTDLTDNKQQFHSQYITLKAGIPANKLFFEAGGCFGMAQAGVPAEDGMADTFDFNQSFAGELGISWILPTKFNSRLSFTGRCASGKGGGMSAFVPLTTKHYRQVFQADMTALTVLTLDYSARLAETLGVTFTASYFIRNDTETFNTFSIESDDNAGNFLGPEIFARFVWSPFSDLQINLGGGAFIPAFDRRFFSSLDRDKTPRRGS